MAVKVTEGKFTYWVNGAGLKVPESMVSDDDKLIDETVTKYIKRALELRKELEKFKADLAGDMNAILALTAEKYGERWQGNATLYDYSKTCAVVIKNQKRKDFTPDVNMAVSMIDSWLDKAATEESLDIISMVRALTKVDEKGKYDKDNLKMLLGIQVSKEADLWEKAMEIIRNSEAVIGTKTYFRFLVRAGENKFDKVILDFSQC